MSAALAGTPQGAARAPARHHIWQKALDAAPEQNKEEASRLIVSPASGLPTGSHAMRLLERLPPGAL